MRYQEIISRVTDEQSRTSIPRPAYAIRCETQNGFALKLYHGTNKEFTTFAPYSHFGAEPQAVMRQSKRVIPVYVRANRLKRMKDTGDWTIAKLRALERQGFDGVVYLNRYEGIPLEQFEAAYAKMSVEKLDRLSDQQFKKLIPAAEDSYIIFDPRNIRMVTQ